MKTQEQLKKHRNELGRLDCAYYEHEVISMTRCIYLGVHDYTLMEAIGEAVETMIKRDIYYEVNFRNWREEMKIFYFDFMTANPKRFSPKYKPKRNRKGVAIIENWEEQHRERQNEIRRDRKKRQRTNLEYKFQHCETHEERLIIFKKMQEIDNETSTDETSSGNSTIKAVA